MELSVIIVNWNTRDLMLRCIQSVHKGLENINVEIIVVDNGSTDGSAEAIRERYPAIELIENRDNLGFAKANNQAILLSKGRYLLLLNPDTHVLNGAIFKMVSFMEATPKAGIVGPQLLNADGSRQNSIANFPTLATELLNKSLLRWLFPDKYPGKERDYLEPVEVESVIGACMMVRRKALEEVGLLDENYFLFMEETDWCYRMKRAGWGVYHLPCAEVIHFQGKSAERERWKAKIEYYRSRYHYFKKNKGRFQHFLLMIGLVAKLLIELIFMSIACALTIFKIKKWRKRLSTYARLAWWHLRLCPQGMGLRSMSNP